VKRGACPCTPPRELACCWAPTPLSGGREQWRSALTPLRHATAKPVMAACRATHTPGAASGAILDPTAASSVLAETLSTTRLRPLHPQAPLEMSQKRRPPGDARCRPVWPLLEPSPTSIEARDARAEAHQRAPWASRQRLSSMARSGTSSLIRRILHRSKSVKSLKREAFENWCYFLASPRSVAPRVVGGAVPARISAFGQLQG
jgi:hypothetical protein